MSDLTTNISKEEEEEPKPSTSSQSVTLSAVTAAPGGGGGVKKRKSTGNKRDSSVVADKNKSIVVIREIYDSEHSIEKFELQLETALRDGVETIILEPVRLGDETSRWISVGNCIHKTAVLSGLGGILATFVWPERPIVFIPISMLSVVATAVYTVSWSMDPCSKYQVETNPARLPSILQSQSTSPIVLVKKDDSRRKILHSVVSITALSYALLKCLSTSQN